MTTPNDEKKTPMTQTNQKPTTVATRSAAMNLFKEALSRSRMRSPQNVNSEAPRPARRVAMQARHQQARELGNLSVYGVR